MKEDGSMSFKIQVNHSRARVGILPDVITFAK